VCFGRPGFWGESGDPLDGCVGETGQDVGQIFANRDGEAAAAFDDGEDSGYARPGLGTADMDPILASCGDSTDILPISVKN